MRALRQILRRLRRSPGFAAASVLTLALGIGVNIAIFGVVNGVLLKALPYPEPDRLAGLWHTAPGITGTSGPNGNLGMCPSMYFTYRERGKAFEALGVWSVGGAAITGVAAPEQVQTLFMTYGVLNALNVLPAMGRWFTESDTKPGAPETVILFHGYWQRQLGGDPQVIGRTLNIDNKARTVIGVMPENFRFLNFAQAQIILPQQFDRTKVFLGQFGYEGLARLKPGVSLEQANADIARLLPIWLNEWPAPPGFSRKLFEDARLGPAVQPLKQEVVGNIGDVLWVLMGAIGIVLLIACANVANLLLVRAEGRQQELAIRAALGANWKTLASEMLFESLVLGVTGGVAGLGLAYGALRSLIAAAPQYLPRVAEIGIDPTVLAFAFSVSLLAAALFGVAPMWRYVSPQVASALRAGGRSMSHSKQRQRARHMLVISQIALALLLLVGSGLMIRTFQALRHVDPGFTHPDTVQIIRVSLPETLVKENARVPRIQQAILDRIAAVPGVKSASYASSVPLDGFNGWDVLLFEDKPAAEGTVPPVRSYRYVAPGFFSTMGTPLAAGQDFRWNDIYDARNVAIVSRNLAMEMWGRPEAALGKRIREGAADPWREIVGVVEDVHSEGLDKPAPRTAYWPTYMKGFYGPEFASRFVAFVIRSDRAGTENLLSDVRKAVWSVQPDLPIYLVQTMQQIYETSMARTSFTLVMLAIAGVMALALAVVGIYGVVAYAVTQRTREIGIRAALGADQGSLKTMFVREGLALAAIGVIIGLTASAALVRWMTALLYGVTALDPVTYAAVPVALLIVVAAASYWPARRAAKVDPLDCLRAD